jgi:predicted nuclease of predicted toxin-antitoxin system
LKVLIDNNLSPRIAAGLSEAGHDAAHLRDYQMQSAPDSEVLTMARESARVLISRDADFSRLLAANRLPAPSVILLKRIPKRNESVLEILVRALPSLQEAVVEGSLIVIEPQRIRVRRLPLPG